MGVNIIATAGSDEGIQSITSFGVQKIYNHCSENYIDQIKESGLKLDVILEMVPNTDLEKDCEIAKVQCRIVVSNFCRLEWIFSVSALDPYPSHPGNLSLLKPFMLTISSSLLFS